MTVRAWGRTLSLALLGTLLGGRPAQAFLRSVSGTEAPLYWSSSCETVTIYLNGYTGMTPDEVAKSIGAAAAAWGPDQVTCPADDDGGSGSGHPSFQIIPQLASGGPAPAAANDGTNAIIFQSSSWDEDVALAYTSVWKEPDGHIVDADVEINVSPEAPYPLANLDPGAAPAGHGISRVDLQTLMTHEFGHFLGLAHPCSGGTDNGDGPPTTPTCADTGAADLGAVMYPYIDPDSTTKRVLTADDARGVCAIYPPGQTVPACAENLPDDGCGCATAPSRDGSAVALALAGLALAATRRRRCRRRPI